jgi:hypothetical protein
MSVSPPVSDAALLAAVANTCVGLTIAAVAVWSGVFVVRVRRLRNARLESAAEEELTGRVLDQISGYAGKSGGDGLGALPGWKRRVLLRVLCGLIEQTKGRDQGQVVDLLRVAGFRDEALNDLRRGNGPRRQDACSVLGCFDDEASTAALRSALADRDGGVRITAARALLQKDRVDSLRELLECLAFSREDPPLVMAELFANLPTRLQGEAVAMLRDPLPAEWLRIVAIALARQQAPDVFEPIAALRHSPAPRVRAAAWVALRELGDPRAGDFVAEGLVDPSPDVRQAASRCAGLLGGPEVLPVIAGMLRDPDWWTAFRAAHALLDAGPAGRARLEEHARTAPAGDAGRQALLEQEADPLAG